MQPLVQIVEFGANEFDVTIDFGGSQRADLPPNWAPVLFAWSFVTTAACNVALYQVADAMLPAHERIPFYMPGDPVENFFMNSARACKRIYRDAGNGVPWLLRFTTENKTENGVFTLLWGWGAVGDLA